MKSMRIKRIKSRMSPFPVNFFMTVKVLIFKQFEYIFIKICVCFVTLHFEIILPSQKQC